MQFKEKETPWGDDLPLPVLFLDIGNNQELHIIENKTDGFGSKKIIDLSKSTESFDQVMILRFTSDEGMKTYGNHADHLKIQEISPPLISGFSLFEYWK